MQDLWKVKEVESVFQADLFDLDDWQKTAQAIPGLESDNEVAGYDLAGQPIQDSFFSLYKPEPTSKSPVPAGLAPLASLINRGMETPAWKGLREHTTGQAIAAGVAGRDFVKSILANLPEEAREEAQKQAQAQQEADEARERAENLQALMDALLQAGQMEEANQAQAAADQAAQVANQAQAAADQAAQAFETALAGNEAQVTAVMNNAAQQAGKEAQKMQSMIKGFSLAAGNEGQMDPETARAAMEVFLRNPHLADLVEMLGWAKNTVRGEWKKAIKGNRNMTGYRAESLNPARMSPVEMVSMTSNIPAIKLGFLKRVAEESVMHRHFDGQEQQGRGPLVLVRDESGSMHGASHSLAVAIEWALLEVARRDKRDFYSIPFSGQGQFSVWQAPAPKKADIAGLMAHLSHFYGGGTEPYQPLEKALDIIEADDLKADVLILTDGVFAEPAQEFIDRVKEAEAKIVTVMIGGTASRAEKFSHLVVNVGNLVADREQLRAAIAEVV